MSVRVRMFAALREAAGEGETVIEPGPLPRLLQELRTRYGEPFGARLALCSVLVEGSSVASTAEIEVPDGAEIALLPPVSGGAEPALRAPRGGRRAGSCSRAAPGVLLLVLAAAALVGAPAAFPTVVVAVAAVTAIDACGLLTRAGYRPVTLAAACHAVGLPLAVTVAPKAGLRLLPAFAAGLTLMMFCLVLGVGREGRRGRPVRRRRIGRACLAEDLGVTAAAALLIGVGAAGLMLLWATPEGPRWVLRLSALVVAADAAGGVLRRWVAAAPFWLELGVALASVTLAAVALVRTMRGPFTLTTSVLLALVALLASVCGTRLQRSVAAEAEPRIRPRGGRAWLGHGCVLARVVALLLAAPAAYLLAHTASA
jgi:molybdopterin converting factor small subunit